jgi:hypothetical protein
MNTVIWIEIDEAARWLSTRPDEVICLIQEGLLGSKRSRPADIVVRADEVERLAKAFKVRKPRSRRVAVQKSSTDQHVIQPPATVRPTARACGCVQPGLCECRSSTAARLN